MRSPSRNRHPLLIQLEPEQVRAEPLQGILGPVQPRAGFHQPQESCANDQRQGNGESKLYAIYKIQGLD